MRRKKKELRSHLARMRSSKFNLYINVFDICSSPI